MKKPFLFIVTFACMALNAFSGQRDTIPHTRIVFHADTNLAGNLDTSLSANRPHRIEYLEIPYLHANDTVIFHTSYSLCFNEKHEQANWVAYNLTNIQTISKNKRTNTFIQDPLVLTGTATNADYAHSGYDRGHLAPAADMAHSPQSMEESFYYSNMSPQKPGFNRGIWKSLEEMVRSWAVAYNDIYIVTGPVLTEGLRTIGPDKVSVPKYFYKVILEYNSYAVKGIGFIFPNRASSQPLQRYCVTIDSVENYTGIDFFPLLPDKEEDVIEATLRINDWMWPIQKAKSKKKVKPRGAPIRRVE